MSGTFSLKLISLIEEGTWEEFSEQGGLMVIALLLLCPTVIFHKKLKVHFCGQTDLYFDHGSSGNQENEFTLSISNRKSLTLRI